MRAKKPRKVDPSRVMGDRIRELQREVTQLERDFALLSRVNDGHEQRVVTLENFLRQFADFLDATSRPKAAAEVRKVLGEKPRRRRAA